MSDIERRLLHAARELRAVPIEPPPLSSLGRPGPRPSGLVARLPALVMPVLFVLGGLAIVAGGLDRPVVDTEQPAADRAVATATAAATIPTAAATTSDGTTSDATTAAGAGVPPAEAASATVEAGTPALTARQEVALIASLRRGPDAPAGEAGDSTLEVRSLQQRYQ